MRSVTKVLAIVAIALFQLPAHAQLKPATVKQIVQPLDTFIARIMKESGIVGIGAAIIIDKEVVWSKGYGYADKEKRIPFTTNTIINIGSISKTFTGACIMKAVEEGKLSLDEDINKYLPFRVSNPYYPNEKITLRQLATHTSSLADRYPFYDSSYYYGGDSPIPLGEFLKDYFDPSGKNYSKESFLNHKPGTYRDYSNIAAGLAGYIVELATGKKLNEYSRQQIFKPLNMVNTGWFMNEVNMKNHSKLYDKETDTLKLIPFYGCATYPDGGVRTSVSELSRFFIALLKGGMTNGARILKESTVHEMLRFEFTESRKPDNVDPAKINSGIFWATKRNVSKIGHAGSDPGVRTEMLCDLSKEVGIVLFSNTSLGDKGTVKYFLPVSDELFKYGALLKHAKNKKN